MPLHGMLRTSEPQLVANTSPFGRRAGVFATVTSKRLPFGPLEEYDFRTVSRVLAMRAEQAEAYVSGMTARGTTGGTGGSSRDSGVDAGWLTPDLWNCPPVRHAPVVQLKVMSIKTLQRIPGEGVSHAYQGFAQVAGVDLRHVRKPSDTRNMIAEANAFES
jgi:hypothetical protein